MSRAIPLIRAAALVPFLRWMLAEGRPIEAQLRAAGLSPALLDDPMQPISLANGLAFLRVLSEREAPDFCCRIISGASVGDISLLARVLSVARTPREALARAVAAMPLHCSHEGLAISRDADGATLREYLDIPCDQRTRHLAQQYVAALIQATCALTGHRGPVFSRLELTAHPGAGLAHLQPWFGTDLVAATSRALIIRIPNLVLDRPYPALLRDCYAQSIPEGWGSLRGDGSFAGSVRILIEAELGERVPDAAGVARAAGMSLRSLQRQFAVEGTTFSRLLDQARRERALSGLAGPDGSIADIAATLGYASQSGLTRAVRRWTGTPPSLLRRSDSR